MLERDRKGKPSAAFRPDFLLPVYDLFLEVTTLNQKLVTKKNRKVRRLRQLYPEVSIKILYQRDYMNLLVKFGLERPSQLGDVAFDTGQASELSFVGDGGVLPLEVEPTGAELRWPSSWPIG